jgi:hypothetical protein
MRYRGSIEGPIDGSKGSVDVGLEKPKRKIGCLISITTPGEWEFGSVRKCLAGQVEIVAVIAPNQKHLKNLQQLIEPALAETEKKRVQFCQPEAFLAFLQQFEIKDLEQEKTVKGYRIKGTFAAMGLRRCPLLSVKLYLSGEDLPGIVLRWLHLHAGQRHTIGAAFGAELAGSRVAAADAFAAIEA